MSTSPITPEEVKSARVKDLPPAVIDCWNALIKKAFKTNRAVITQEDAVQALQTSMGLQENQTQTVFTEGWLDIEPLFRSAGWDVVYDKPGYNESYKATYTFTAPRRDHEAQARSR